MMKDILTGIFDLIFPRGENDATIAGLSPEDFWRTVPRWQGEAYPDVWAIFHYRHPAAKAMIKELKGSESRHAARIAGRALLSFFQENGIDAAVIVPMPLSARRRRERGYNQCESAAASLLEEASRAGMDGFRMRADALVRTKDGPKSALQGRAGRAAAIRGVFAAGRRTLSGETERIIVIDDVVTTGSTMREAIETLRQAGAAGVSGVGIAH